MQSNDLTPQEEFDDLVLNHSVSGQKRIRELMEMHGFYVPRSSPPLVKLNLLSNKLRECLMASSPNREAGMRDYYLFCFNDAVKNDDAKEILYLLEKVPTALLNFGEDLNFFQSVIVANKKNILKALIKAYKHALEQKNLEIDSNLYRLVNNGINQTYHLAVKHNHDFNTILFLRALYVNQFNDALEHYNTANLLLEIAKKNNNDTLIRLFEDEKSNTYLNVMQNTLMISDSLPDNYFVELKSTPSKNILTLKGAAMLLDYYKNKNDRNNPTKIFIAPTEKALLHALELFSVADENKLRILLQYENHYSELRLERYENTLYAISIDSLSFYSAGIFSTLSKQNTNLLSQYTYLYNDEVQQSSGDHCLFFALKNGRLADQANLFIQEIMELQNEKKLTNNEAVLEEGEYTLPARFMHLASSYDKIKNYIENYPELANKTLRIKDGKEQNLEAYAYHHRNKFIETPIQVKNKNKQKVKNKLEPEMVSKNKTIEHFRVKYTSEIIQNQLEKYKTYEQRRALLESYNIELAHLSSDKKIIPKTNIESKMSDNNLFSQSSKRKVDQIINNNNSNDSDSNTKLKK